MKLTDEINSLAIVTGLIKNANMAFDQGLKLVVIEAVAKSPVETDIHKTRVWLTNNVFDYFGGLRVTTGAASSTYCYLTSIDEDLKELNRKLQQAERQTFKSTVIVQVIGLDSQENLGRIVSAMVEALNTRVTVDGRKSFCLLGEKLPLVFPKKRRA